MQIIKTIFGRLRDIIKYGYYIPNQYYSYPDKKLIYIPIPKVACTSIKTTIMGNNTSKPDQDNYNTYMNIHSEATKEHEQLSLKGYEDYYKIAFVRSPFDRLVSCYEDKLMKNEQHTGRHYFTSRYNNIFINIVFGRRFTQDMSFDEFVSLVSRIPDRLSDAHFKSQYAFLYKNNTKVPDYIGKFENLTDDWKPIAEKYGIAELPMMNKSKRQSWKEYYTSIETIEHVAKRYKNDIELLGYINDYEMLIKNTH
jgi:hypothetical protein